MKQKAAVLIRNQRMGIQMSDVGMKRGTGPSGPPKNKVTTTADMVMVFMNSARKNNPKRMEEYSVWNPPTSSCSASGRSKGGGGSSAVMAIMKKMNGRNPSRMRFQSQKPCAWASTMARV